MDYYFIYIFLLILPIHVTNAAQENEKITENHYQTYCALRHLADDYFNSDGVTSNSDFKSITPIYREDWRNKLIFDKKIRTTQGFFLIFTEHKGLICIMNLWGWDPLGELSVLPDNTQLVTSTSQSIFQRIMDRHRLYYTAELTITEEPDVHLYEYIAHKNNKTNKHITLPDALTDPKKPFDETRKKTQWLALTDRYNEENLETKKAEEINTPKKQKPGMITSLFNTLYSLVHTSSDSSADDSTD